MILCIRCRATRILRFFRKSSKNVLFSWDNKKYFVTLHASEIMMLMSENQLDKNFPQMSFEELEDCMPLDVAFDMLRDKARKYYVSKP